ncbi:MAG: DUF1440 domain-containing protein [Terriglobus roseus]|nr:DUF1440 domain-containing protein [Terriglobus roseus]
MAKEPHQLTHPTHSLLKGAVAGLIGGLVATGAKTLAESIYPPRTHGEPEPTDVAVEKLGGDRKETTRKKVETEGVHWGFGALAGAAYGVIAEVYPQVTAKNGITFGMTLMAFAHEGALPALGLSAPPKEQKPREQRSEMITHVVYGFVAETVRKVVRKSI